MNRGAARSLGLCYQSVVSERPKGKSIGRRAGPKVEAQAARPATQSRETASAKAAPSKSSKKQKAIELEKPAPRAKGIVLRPAEQALLESLAGRTRLSESEVVARALQSYAAAVAPELRSAPQTEASEGESERLFISVDGRPELEITSPEFVFGSGEGCDLQLNLPLIAERHARVLLRDGRHLFEDLRSAKGSYRHGQLVDVRFLEDGDEIDLGGFLPVRFRIERAAGGA